MNGLALVFGLTLAALSSPPSLAAPGTAPYDEALRTASERNTVEIFRAVAPAVVFVTQKQRVRDVWTMRAREVETGSGTGFLWDKRGHVVTNFHVVQGASAVTVTLQDQRTYAAALVGVDPRKDIAVLRIDPEDPRALTAVTLPPEGTRVEVGQKAIAIGNPFGLDHTLTVGVVSALGREVQGIGGVTIRDMIQTDAAINPGNSGGPLLDSAGRLMGMNTAIFSRSGSSAGIGFAVPVKTIRRIVPQIIRTGRAEQVGMGITILDDSIARRNGIEGVIIARVIEGSPADRAGLLGIRERRDGIQLGDVIVGIGKQPVRDYDDLYGALDRHAPGDVVRVHILRGRKRLTKKVRLILIN